MAKTVFRKRRDNGIPFPILKKKGKTISLGKGTLKPTGIKLKNHLRNPSSPESRELIEGVEERILTAPKSVQDSVKEIEFKDKQPDEDYIAKIETSDRKIEFNQKDNLNKKKYQVLTEHELQHQWFKDTLVKADPKIFSFITNAQSIKPFSDDLREVHNEIIDARKRGDELNETLKMLEYADEINSNVAEVLMAKKLGVPVKPLNEKDYQEALKIVRRLHS